MHTRSYERTNAHAISMNTFKILCLRNWFVENTRRNVAPTEQIFLFINETPTHETCFFRENVTALQNMWLILVTNLLKAAGYESFVFFKDF